MYSKAKRINTYTMSNNSYVGLQSSLKDVLSVTLDVAKCDLDFLELLCVPLHVRIVDARVTKIYWQALFKRMNGQVIASV